MTRLRALLIKEFLQMSRDRMTLAMLIILPIIQLLIFGYGINTDVKHLPTVVFDQSLTHESRDMLNSFSSTSYYDIKFIARNFQEVTEIIDSGQAKVGIIFPPDFSENVKHGRSASIQVLVDASDNMTANSAISTAQLVGQVNSQKILIKKLRMATGQIYQPAYDIRIRPWYNPDFVSPYYMVPGIIGIVVTMTMVMLTSIALVREREFGTLEQLLVTPLKTYELIIGKIIPYILVGFIQVALTLSIGLYLFDIPVKGSMILLYIMTLSFLLASLGLGIMISTIAQNQMQAMQMAFFVLVPSVLLSGFVVPRVSMHIFFYYLGYLFPMTFYLEIIRGILLKGNSFQHLWFPFFSLLFFTIITLTISIKRFKRTLA